MAHKDWRRKVSLLLRSLPLAVGLSISLFAGFCDTLWSPHREWEKTLREGESGLLQGSRRRWVRSAWRLTMAEMVLGGLSLAFLVLAVRNGYWESWVPLLFLTSGYLLSAFTSVSEIVPQLRGRGRR
jgi:hypothetical protein